MIRRTRYRIPYTKYRNRPVVTSDGRFDSQRELRRWGELKLLQKAGRITGLQRQVRIPLYAPWLVLADENAWPKRRPTHAHVTSPQPSDLGDRLSVSPVCVYVADFVYREAGGALVVEDAKGCRTALYRLKAKWLEAQTGLVIRET